MPGVPDNLLNIGFRRLLIAAMATAATAAAQPAASDYREIAGVRVPFKMVVTWTDGQSNILFTEVQPNAAIDAMQFAKPAPAVLKPKGGAR